MKTLVDNLGNKKAKLMEYFLQNPTKEVHIRSLARQLNISSTWVSKAARQLAKSNLLLVAKSKERKEVLIKANRQSANYQAVKKAFNFYTILSSGIVDYLAQAYLHPECVVLFGSYAKGEDSESSDIDIAVITSRDKKLDLSRFENFFGMKINLLQLSKQNIEKDFWNTLANGIVLYGYLEVPL